MSSCTATSQTTAKAKKIAIKANPPISTHLRVDLRASTPFPLPRAVDRKSLAGFEHLRVDTQLGGRGTEGAGRVF